MKSCQRPKIRPTAIVVRLGAILALTIGAGDAASPADPYAGAPELARRESPRADGSKTRVRIIRAPFKRPLLRIKEEIGKHPLTGVEVVRSQAVMVADQLIVKTKPKVAKRALTATLGRFGATLQRTIPHSRIHVVQLPHAGVDSVPDAVKALAAKAGVVEYAEPDFVVRTDALPDDTNFSMLWGLHNNGQKGGVADADIDAPEAWDLATGSHDVLIAVIDSGIDYNHPDLAPNLWTNPHEIAGNGIDDDANGYIDDTRGWDFANADNDPLDDNSHGTHCAGTIGAAGNNALGVTGVCWEVSLVGLKFMDAGGSGLTSDAAEAVLYATRIGARATSNSWGGAPYLQSLKDAIDGANAAGILFIAAAGNAAKDLDATPGYPSSYDCPNIISVAATDRWDGLAGFSNRGATTVDLAAPGEEIVSCYPGGIYVPRDGTSMAAPYVTGACALLLADQPGLSHLAVKDLLLGSVDQVPSLAGRVVSHGRLNLHRALTASHPDYFTEAFDSSGNDTAYQTFTFTPDGSPDHYRATRQPAAAFPTNPAGGNPLPMGDDESLLVTLGAGATVPLYGTAHASFHVGSNGYVTFGAADFDFSESLPDHFRLPRISALFDDLNPGEGGMISWKQLPDRVAVTFSNVLEASLEGTNSFQIEMFFDGRIRITILGISATDGLIGLSRGTGVPAAFHESDFSDLDPPPPEILAHPAGLTASIGSMAALAVEASGSGAIWYLWRRNGTPLDAERAPILTFTAVRPEHAGSYEVMVFNSRTSVTSSAALFTVSTETIANGSFESGFTGWTTTGHLAVMDGPPYAATHGAQLAVFNAANATPDGILTQRFATLPGLEYVLEFDVGAFSTLTAEARLGIEVSGASPLVSATVSIPGPGGAGTAWMTRYHEFTADSSVTTLVFRDLSAQTTGVDLVLDRVRLSPQPGTDLVVTTLADEDDGLLGQGIGDSLREVLSVARWVPGTHSIRFAPSLAGGTINVGAIGQLTVNSDLTIDASDLPERITVSGNDTSRILEVTDGVTASVASLTFTNGRCEGGSGGGILNSGILSLTDAVIRRCWRWPVGSNWGDGGGIHNEGTLDLIRTTVWDNGIAFGTGGAVGNSGTLRMVNCTVTSNLSFERGGGVSNSGEMTILQSTISDNESLMGGGGGLLNTGSLVLVNSIVAGNLSTSTDPNLSGPLEPASGNNLLEGDPELAPLADFGGPTPTMPPLPGSPAIEGGMLVVDPPTVDQRGAPRLSGNHVDLGSVEAFPFSTIPMVDTDGDRIDDRLEPSYRLTVGVDDSAADSDRDGTTDAEELADMTDPLDANSRLKITALEKARDYDPVAHPSFDVHFTSFPGLSYTLECDQALDFASPQARHYPCGAAFSFTTQVPVVLLPGRDFVRVRRDP